jgi:hypothetical protein
MKKIQKNMQKSEKKYVQTILNVIGYTQGQRSNYVSFR